MIYEFEGKKPSISDSCYVHPQATIIGSVQLGAYCYVGAGAVIRADYGQIIIGTGSAVEDNCVIHSNPGTMAIIKDRVIIGHGAIIHGSCLIKYNAIVGMGSIISVDCELGEQSFLGAGSVLPPGKTVPDRKLAVGNPARVVRDMDQALLAYNQLAAETYQDLALRSINSLRRID